MSGAASVVQMVFSLAAVVAIILGLAWMTRRMQGLRATSNADLRVKSSVAVGMKERVVLIEACGQQILIGVAPGQVTMLKALGAISDSPSPCGRGLGGGVVPSNEPSTPPSNSLPQGDGEKVAFADAFALQLNKLLGR